MHLLQLLIKTFFFLPLNKMSVNQQAKGPKLQNENHPS